jgi:hypothetical protein
MEEEECPGGGEAEDWSGAEQGAKHSVPSGHSLRMRRERTARRAWCPPSRAACACEREGLKVRVRRGGTGAEGQVGRIGGKGKVSEEERP